MFNFFLRSRAEQFAPESAFESAPYLQALQIEYLLKELEFQVAFEANARDRAEQMVSYLMTTIAAILGAVLLIVQNAANYLLVAFIAALLIWMFSAFSFYRVCRLRNAITHARLNRRLIRGALEKAGLTLANSDSEPCCPGLELVVLDNGRGMAFDGPIGLGLLSMQARAAEVGGVCTIDANPAGGTRITVRLPCEVQEE